MRQKRAKAYRKLMHVYCMNFGFRQPYQVLVDSQICSEAVSSKIDLSTQLAVVLQGTVKPMITQCSIHSLYIAGKAAQPIVDLAKTFERRRCNHREAIPEEECLKDVIGSTNKHRYVLAAQPVSLRHQIRQVPGVPIVHIKRSVMVLEPASQATEHAKSTSEAERLNPSAAETNAIESTLAEHSRFDTVVSSVPKKKRGPKGPNPLSVKKKKKKTKDNNNRLRIKRSKEPVDDRPAATGEKRKRDDDDGKVHGQDGARKCRVLTAATVTRPRKRLRKRRCVLASVSSEG